jgi:hypothetical protein
MYISINCIGINIYKLYENMFISLLYCLPGMHTIFCLMHIHRHLYIQHGPPPILINDNKGI